MERRFGALYHAPMLRLIAVLIFGALFAALLFGPRVHPSAMAPKQIADLLEEPGIRAGATEPAVDEKGKPIPLWRYIVDSGTVAVDPETGEVVASTTTDARSMSPESGTRPRATVASTTSASESSTVPSRSSSQTPSTLAPVGRAPMTAREIAVERAPSASI